GSFAELVAVHAADANLVALPAGLDFVTAACLGCRFATAFRAVTAHGRVRPGDWLAVHGCGGVGLSAVLSGVALGARVLAVDVSPAGRPGAAPDGSGHSARARDLRLARHGRPRLPGHAADGRGRHATPRPAGRRGDRARPGGTGPGRDGRTGPGRRDDSGQPGRMN